MCVDNLRIGDVHLLDGLLRILGLVPGSNTQHLKLVSLVLLIHLDEVGNLCLAGTAPAGPEINEDILALANIVAEFLHLAVVLTFEVREHLAFARSLFGLLGLCLFLGPGLLISTLLVGPLLQELASLGIAQRGIHLVVGFHGLPHQYAPEHQGTQFISLHVGTFPVSLNEFLVLRHHLLTQHLDLLVALAFYFLGKVVLQGLQLGIDLGFTLVSSTPFLVELSAAYGGTLPGDVKYRLLTRDGKEPGLVHADPLAVIDRRYDDDAPETVGRGLEGKLAFLHGDRVLVLLGDFQFFVADIDVYLVALEVISHLALNLAGFLRHEGEAGGDTQQGHDGSFHTSDVFCMYHYFMYSARSVRRMSPLRRKVSCMAKAAESSWCVCPPFFSAYFR